MKRVPKIESGIELLSRLGKRPSIGGLDDKILFHGPNPGETIEISGNLSSGKTLLLTQLIAKCILPSVYEEINIGGKNAAVLFINTDHHLRISKMVRLMENFIKEAYEKKEKIISDAEMRELIIIPSLENLIVVHCYDNNEFKLTLSILDDIFMKNPRISLIALDSISFFYWQDREVGGVWSMDRYLKNILKNLQQYTFQYKIVLVYTRSDDFASKINNSIELASEPTLEKINCRINLLDNVGIIENAGEKKEIKFIINNNGIRWIVEEI